MPSPGRIASTRRPQLVQGGDRREQEQGGDRREREARFLSLASSQHGVVTYSQLRSLGFSGGSLRHRVATGRLHALHRGVYAVGRPDISSRGRWLAAVLACGPGALLSHLSAASLHGLLASAQEAIDVSVPHRTGLSRPGIRVHRPASLVPEDRAWIDRIACTSIARTLLDLARVAHRRVLERACEQAEVLDVLDWAAMERTLSRARGRVGVRSLRAALGGGCAEDGLPRSELERRFLVLCRRARLPRPAVNQWITVAGEEMQVDFIWHGEGLIAETDGFDAHRTWQAFQRDRRRDQLLSSTGWRVLRFTWHEVTEQPAHVTAVLSKLLSEAAKGAAPGAGRLASNR